MKFRRERLKGTKLLYPAPNGSFPRNQGNSVAGALAGVLRENGKAEIQAIGAGALNQAVKAIAIARGFVAPHGMDLICVPAFIDITIDGEERTAIKLLIEPR